jgi:Ca-activated chloride channel family protein
MKNAKKFIAIILAAMMLLTLASCNASPDKEGYYGGNTSNGGYNGGYNNDNNFAPGGNYVQGDDAVHGEMEMPSLAPSEEADMESADCEILPSEPPTEPSPIIQILENDFTKTAEQAISTFSADVDTASYTYLRKLTSVGYKFDQLKATAGRAIRTEELVNYFSYNYSAPKNGELLGKNVTISKSPWNNDTMLLTIGLKAPEAEVEVQNNLVFLIDVSGSMSGDDKLGLLKKAFSYLTENLDKNDRVSIVTYAGNERVVLDGCEGYRKADILNAINNLQSGGSTNGEAGIVKAYELAEKHFIAGGNNRIIMASDGDLNVGISSADQLTSYIEQKRDQGIYLSVLGFGTGNYRDANMEAIADNGNGVYYYIDGISEAEKVFGTDLFGTLYTVAEDVKLQVDFNSARVESYRLIGYENRLLANEDFENDQKDAGEVGASHQVTVCYEIKLRESQNMSMSPLLTLRFRYKNPGEPISNLDEHQVGLNEITTEMSDDMKFITSVIETCMILRSSKYIGDITLEEIMQTLSSLTLDDPYKAEFYEILQTLVGK